MPDHLHDPPQRDTNGPGPWPACATSLSAATATTAAPRSPPLPITRPAATADPAGSRPHLTNQDGPHGCKAQVSAPGPGNPRPGTVAVTSAARSRCTQRAELTQLRPSRSSFDPDREFGPASAPVDEPTGDAARSLLAYVAALPLEDPDAQLLAVVVSIRAARGGVGNLTGTDLRALRLADTDGAVAALTALGWQSAGELLLADPQTPVGVSVPDLADTVDRTLPFGKAMRSKVSGWSTRTAAAKPLRKTSATMRLAALFLAAHGSSDCHRDLPADLPEHCRAVLPDLVDKGFLAELDGDRYRLHEAVSHLSGRDPDAEVCRPAAEEPGPVTPAARCRPRRRSARPCGRRGRSRKVRLCADTLRLSSTVPSVPCRSRR
ncbi:hypothetical protein NKH18_05925 [Streptomyces sp. M10(2022)]